MALGFQIPSKDRNRDSLISFKLSTTSSLPLSLAVSGAFPGRSTTIDFMLA